MSHLSSGIDVLIQRGDLFFGTMNFINDSLSIGAIRAIYLEWNATPDVFTSFAKVPSSFNSCTNLLTAIASPEMVTVSSALWQAGRTPSGHLFLASAQVRPTAAIAPGGSLASWTQRPKSKQTTHVRLLFL